MKRILAVAVVTVFGLGAEAVTVSNSATPVQGVWNANYGSTKAYAEANHLPMLIFWGSSGCSQCGKMKKAIDTADFIKWQNDQKLVMVFVEGTATADARECKAFVKNSSLEFPYMGVYWKKSSGATVKQLFTGRSGSLPASGSTLQAKLMNTVAKYLDGWDAATEPSVGGDGDDCPDCSDAPEQPAVVISPEWNKSRTLVAAIVDVNEMLVGAVEYKIGRKNNKDVAKVSAKASIVGRKAVSFMAKSINVSESNNLSWTRAGMSMVSDISHPNDLSGEVTVDGKRYYVCAASMGGATARTLNFCMEGNLPETINGLPVIGELLPQKSNPQQIIKTKKWTMPKAGRLIYNNETHQYSMAGNSSGLKLTYKSTNGYFSGFFYVYTETKPGKVRKVKATVEGFYAEGIGGDGLVTIRNVGTYGCRVEAID